MFSRTKSTSLDFPFSPCRNVSRRPFFFLGPNRAQPWLPRLRATARAFCLHPETFPQARLAPPVPVFPLSLSQLSPLIAALTHSNGLKRHYRWMSLLHAITDLFLHPTPIKGPLSTSPLPHTRAPSYLRF
jgi:hypothetical protein